MVRGVDRLFKQEKRLGQGRPAGRSAVQTGMTMVCEYIGGRSEEDGTWGRSAVQTGKTIGPG